jgi:regulator of protease activity HflC (stomatin/prohibitin superfamily)
MIDQPPTDTTAGYPQLAQVRVPLRQAGEVLAVPDASGRTPIVVVVEAPSRINPAALALAGLVALIGLLGGLQLGNLLLLAAGVPIGIVIAVVAVMRSFRVQIPEGANGLLVRKGAHAGMLGPGSHMIPPWVGISHLVTRREIPYDAPIVEAPTRDNVRAWVDSMITFSIADPYRFVFNITATDFDAVLAASCQDAFRRMIRSMTWDQIGDLTRRETDDLRTALDTDVEGYGATISRVTITYARPPADFLLSEEARQLAVLQRAEHAERHALALRLQSDEDELAHQRSLARVARERDELEIRIQEAEIKRRVADLEAETLSDRLAKLEEALERYPHAAKYDFEGAQLEAVRALATNTRAVVQLGSADEVGRALVVRDILHGALGDGPPNGDRAVAEGQHANAVESQTGPVAQ